MLYKEKLLKVCVIADLFKVYIYARTLTIGSMSFKTERLKIK